MHANTPRGSSVTATPASIPELAALLYEQLRQARRIYLRGNAPRDPRVHQLERDMATPQDGSEPRKKAIERTLTVEFAMIDDGAPAAAVAAWHLTAIALIEERAQARALARGEPVVGPDPRALIDRENEVQALKDRAERAVVANPQSPDALRTLLDADAQYEIVNDRLLKGIRWSYARSVSGRGMASV
jgi:hypothetical protein